MNKGRKRIEILDNLPLKRGIGLKDKYGSEIEETVPAFGTLMETLGWPEAKEFANYKVVALKLKWQDQENNKDCGVYCMRHMETYHGEPISKWTCGLSPKTSTKTIDELRVGYLSAILQFTTNKRREHCSGLAMAMYKGALYRDNSGVPAPK